MRGAFEDQGRLFSYISPEARVPANHPLRKIRELEPVIPLHLYKTAQSAWLTGSLSNSCLSASFPARLAVTMV